MVTVTAVWLDFQLSLAFYGMLWTDSTLLEVCGRPTITAAQDRLQGPSPDITTSTGPLAEPTMTSLALK